MRIDTTPEIGRIVVMINDTTPCGRETRRLPTAPPEKAFALVEIWDYSPGF
jgi:hypothetical protein